MDITERKERFRKWTTLGLIAVAGLIVSPLIFLAIKGIVGLAIAAVAGLAIVTFTPIVAMKFANWKVKAIASEAKENPIETLVNLLEAKKQAYAAFRTSVEDAVTARKDFETKCLQFSTQYPARASEFNQQLAAMTDLVDRKKQALKEAKESLALGDGKLSEMRAYWEMSQAAQAAQKAAGMDTGDLFEKLKADTAVDAVFESMNKAFARLEVAAELDNVGQIAHNTTEVNLNVIQIKDKVIA